MIVNPQPFNFRFIISSLLIVIIILGFYSYNSFITLQNQKAFIEQENQLVQNELSKMIENYNTVTVKNNRVSLKLEGAETKLNKIIDSIKVLPKKSALINHYNAEIRTVEASSAATLSVLKAYKNENSTLREQLRNYTNKENIELNKTKIPIEKIEQDLFIPSIISSPVVNTVTKSPEHLISIKNIKAQGVKRVTSKNRIITTRTASKANQLHVSFTVPKSELLDPNRKTIYIQILDANNNVVGDKGSVNFGNRNLIFSKKAIITKDNRSVKISTLIKTNKNEPLIKGVYRVNVFQNSSPVAKTNIYLK